MNNFGHAMYALLAREFVFVAVECHISKSMSKTKIVNQTFEDHIDDSPPITQPIVPIVPNTV